MPLLTIFTPTFNREKTLVRLYDSLRRQTCKDFLWLVIDDGSTDNTEIWITDIQKQGSGFEVEYIKKENGGLHTGYNCAIANSKTELMVCIDSDDYLPDNAVELISYFWQENGSDAFAGIVGLDYYAGTDQIVGDKLPNQKSVNLIDLLIGKYKLVNGDRTNVVRTSVYKEVAPMHVFTGEKNFNPHYLHLLISKKYDFLVLNRNLRYVDYQKDGMSNSIFKQYYSSPNSFAEIRKLYLSFDHIPFGFKLKNTIHLIASCFLARNIIKAFRYSKDKVLTFLFLPIGLLFAGVIKIIACK